MSPAAAAAARAARALPRPETNRPSLRLVVTRPLVAGRTPFAVLVGLILTTGLVALLLLHTLAAQDAFRLQELQHRAAGLADVEQELRLAEQQREDPATLAARARALGMVPTESLAFVRLHKHGRIVGVARAAAAPPPPAPTAEPSHHSRSDRTQQSHIQHSQKSHKPHESTRRGTDKPRR